MRLRSPTISDGVAVNELVTQSPPLDPNSCYCNLLQCTHFAGTSVAAELDNNIVGFVSGYSIPQREQELFIWQVMVAPQARGQNLGVAMLEWLVDELNPAALETSITATNAASWRLFERLAKERGATLVDAGSLFDSKRHFAGRHATERLVRITPQLGNQSL